MNRHSNSLVAVAITATIGTLALAFTDEEKISDAMSAAPSAISADATIVDWPSAAGGEMRVLRDGTNGWVCYPTSPGVAALRAGDAVGAPAGDPMCLDAVWQGWFAALLQGATPVIDRIGIAYMLLGDGGASNVDPFATGPTADNEWHASGPHLMILAPPGALEGLSVDYHSGEPYVMWAGTPYAHIMVPVARHPTE
jgi:hypothetical protein